jgi:lipoate-protein ligase A
VVLFILHNNNSNIKTNIVRSLSNDPWYNLALEEYLLKKVGRNQVTLYLWQNNNTIVIGRNQNPWKECRCKQFEEDGGKIARRLSGGGAVFHDLGNLNFTFIMDKSLQNLNTQLQVILQAVKNLGINAEFSGRNDIVVEGKKFSGNAFYEEDSSAYHHGTILVNSDMNKLTTYLQVSNEKIKSKGIDSVRSRVINLKSINTDITIETVMNNLQESFCKIYGGSPNIKNIDKNTCPLEKLYSKYCSWNWKYGESPNFDIYFEKRFNWGGFDIGFKLNNACISSCTIYSDAMNSKLIQSVSKSLEGIPFKMNYILNALNNMSNETNENIINDIKNLLSEKIN